MIYLFSPCLPALSPLGRLIGTNLSRFVNKFFLETSTITGKIPSVAYNRNSGDACFRSLLTPHSARTIVRAVPYIASDSIVKLLCKTKFFTAQAKVFAMVEFSPNLEI